MGVVETLVIILAIASSAVVVGFLLLARTGFIVAPKPMDTPAPQMGRQKELLREISQINEKLSAEFWRRYYELVAKRDADLLIPDRPELQELIRMTDDLELRQAERLEILSKLARLRKATLSEVMKHSDVPVLAHG
ncbi:MAG: hypothetical protein ACHRXM_22315 [Isosphaerales bacterium]